MINKNENNHKNSQQSNASHGLFKAKDANHKQEFLDFNQQLNKLISKGVFNKVQIENHWKKFKMINENENNHHQIKNNQQPKASDGLFKAKDANHKQEFLDSNQQLNELISKDVFNKVHIENVG